MLLFKKPFHRGLVDGSIRLTFRRWDRPHVRVGGRYRCHPIGVLEVDDIRTVRVREIDEADARAAGFASRAELIAFLKAAPGDRPVRATTEVYRIALHHGGDGDRVELALEAELDAAAVDAITAKLARLDRPVADRAEPWTRATLALIEANPRVAASKLAAKVGRETAPFKVDVRKLKRLGLTQSFEVGYEVSPRGRAYLSAIGPTRPSRRAARRTPAR